MLIIGANNKVTQKNFVYTDRHNILFTQKCCTPGCIGCYLITSSFETTAINNIICDFDILL